MPKLKQDQTGSSMVAFMPNVRFQVLILSLSIISDCVKDTVGEILNSDSRNFVC